MSFKVSQFSRNFKDVSPFIRVNIHFKVKPLQPNRTQAIALQLPQVRHDIVYTSSRNQ